MLTDILLAIESIYVLKVFYELHLLSLVGLFPHCVLDLFDLGKHLVYVVVDELFMFLFLFLPSPELYSLITVHT